MLLAFLIFETNVKFVALEFLSLTTRLFMRAFKTAFIIVVPLLIDLLMSEP